MMPTYLPTSPPSRKYLSPSPCPVFFQRPETDRPARPRRQPRQRRRQQPGQRRRRRLHRPEVGPVRRHRLLGLHHLRGRLDLPGPERVLLAVPVKRPWARWPSGGVSSFVEQIEQDFRLVGSGAPRGWCCTIQDLSTEGPGKESVCLYGGWLPRGGAGKVDSPSLL